MVKGEFCSMSFDDLNEFDDSPEGQYIAKVENETYRKAYWDGMHKAIELLKSGADARQLDNFLWGELKKWRYGHKVYSNPKELEVPPSIIPWRELRKYILLSYNEICAYCGDKATHVDHVMPVSKGGGYEIENLVAACAKCNFKKGTYLLEETNMEIKYYPIVEIKIVKHYDYVTIEVGRSL